MLGSVVYYTSLLGRGIIWVVVGVSQCINMDEIFGHAVDSIVVDRTVQYAVSSPFV